MADATADYGGRKAGFTEVAPGEYARQVHAVNLLNAATAQQRVYLATTDEINVSLGGNLRGTLENPAESDKNLYVFRIVAVKEETGFIYSDFFLNPTTGLPTTTVTPMNSVIGSQQSPNGIIKVDAGGTALSGGTDLNSHMAINQGRTEIDLPPVVVAPGLTLGVNIPVGALESGTGQLSLYWFED